MAKWFGVPYFIMAPLGLLFALAFKTKISNGNRTEWSPIWSVIIRVINKIRRPRSGSPIRLIMSMITDRIGRHKVLLPINHNFNEICDIWGSFFNQKTKNSEIVFASSEKKSHLSVRVIVRTVQLRILSYLTVLLRLKSGQLIANQI